MGIINNIFKKEEGQKKVKTAKTAKTGLKEKKASRPQKAKTEALEEIKKPEVKKPSLKSAKEEEGKSGIHRILKNPHITEKATFLAEKNQYVFKVYDSTNKNEVKKAVEGYYKVDVAEVRMIKIPSKKRRFKKGIGIKQGYKKAIVKIKEGQKIEVLPR